MAKTATEKYQIQQIMTASPARLVAMLYDKAISCLHDAIRAIEAGDIEARWKANTRAREVITHLLSTLDMEKGADIAKNLSQLYRFMLTHLLDVDIKNNPVPALEVIRLLEPLRKSWHIIAERGGGEALPADPMQRPDAANPQQRPDIKIALSA
jgi:flagellar secretion chaperone FliS